MIVTLRGVPLSVRLAETSFSRAKGLLGERSMGHHEGMLFRFPRARQYCFWTFGMRFPIDILWFRERRLLEIEPSVAPSRMPWRGLFRPREDVDMVLELAAGAAARCGFAVGDLLSFPEHDGTV